MNNNINDITSLEGEFWRKIPNSGGQYLISNKGRVYSLKTNKFIKTPIDGRGYPNFNIIFEGKRKNLKLHRVLGLCFIPNYDNKPEINHIDGNKENFNLENLEWVTSRENNIHARMTGLHRSDGDKPILQYDLEGNFIKRYKSISQASRETTIERGNITAVAMSRKNKKGYTYKTAGGYIWKYEK